MKAYMVHVQDLDGEVSQTICQDDRDLVILINNIDKQIYEILAVEKIDNYLPNNEFLAKNKGLETGTKTGLDHNTIA